MARNDFEGQSGGAGITDFEFEVTDAYFAEPDARYVEELAKSGATAGPTLHLIGTTNLPDHPVLDDGGFHPSYTLATGWIPVENGKRVENGDPKARVGKAYGRFCDAVVRITDDVADTPADPLYGANHPTKAETWIGTKWFMENIEQDFGKAGKKRELMPTKFLGRVSGGGTASTPAASSSSTPSGLRAQVEAALASSGTFPEFQTKLLAISGITQDPALLQEALNPAFFASNKG